MTDEPRTPYAYRCISGRHVWTERRDAEKCCNGWHRELVIGTDYHAQRDATYTPLRDFDVTPAGKLWVRDIPGERYWWGVGIEHSDYEAIPA